MDSLIKIIGAIVAPLKRWGEGWLLADIAIDTGNHQNSNVVMFFGVRKTAILTPIVNLWRKNRDNYF